MKLKDEANNYQPPQIANITELKKISVEEEIFDDDGTASDGTKFKYKYVLKDDVKYRIPGVVIGDMKNILEQFPDTTHFIVTKKGEGMKTRYQVMPAGPG